jgi:hypothetical protein
MKSIKFLLLPIVVVLSFSTCIDTDPPVVPGPDENMPQPTLVGFPIDIPTTKTIGAAGGMFSSLDERITLTIPAGALSGDTEITIQPIANFAPNGNGNGYQLSPEGVKFNKPIKITFKHGQEVSATIPPLTGIAFQGTDGIWYTSGKLTWDEVNKTVSTETTHFSSWANFDNWKLIHKNGVVAKFSQDGRGSYKLNIDESAEFELVVLDYEDFGEELSPLFANATVSVIEEWSVNGDVNGQTGVYGKITPNAQEPSCTYKAPAEAPKASKNPVLLATELKDVKYRDPRTGQVFNNLLVSVPIDIVGDFEWDFVIKYHNDKAFSGGLVNGFFTSKDSASMKILFKNDVFTFSNFTNSLGAITPTTKTDLGNNKSTVQSDPVLGPLNITGATGVYTNPSGKKILLLSLSNTAESPAFFWVGAGGQTMTYPGGSGPLDLHVNFTLSDSISTSTYHDGGNIISAKITLIE